MQDFSASVRGLLRWHTRHGRSDLPWRRRRTAYRTLVSEFMAQQTQVGRVVQKFNAFMARYPTVGALAAGPRAEVLRAWRGLGYNARAIRLHAAATMVMTLHRGRIPRDARALRALPGVGPYTAAAIRAFAYDLDDLPVDVNIGRVLHRAFFGLEHPPKASLAKLAALGLQHAGGGYRIASALMDLGAALCTARKPLCGRCPLRRGCAAAPVDALELDALRAARKRPAAIPFKETARHARGRIVDRLRALAPRERISLLDLHYELRDELAQRSLEQMRVLVDALQRDGLVLLQGEDVSLP